MRVRTLLVATSTACCAALLGGCLGLPLPFPVPTSSPTAGASTTPATPTASTTPATPTASLTPTKPATSPPPPPQPSAPATTIAPDPKASQHIPDVGQMPSGFTLPRKGYQISRIEAITSCKLVWYPGLSQRVSSRFRMAVSETGESGGADGVVIMSSEASAKQLMTEIKDAVQACLQADPGRLTKTLPVPLAGPWQDSIAFAWEQRNSKGQRIDDAFGTEMWVVRKGRVIVGTTDWTMYAHPITEDPFDEAPALARLATMLKSAKA